MLTGKPGAERELLARALDLAEAASRYHQPQFTDFYDPYHTGLIISTLGRLSTVKAGSDGGYPGAERQRVVICPDYLEPEEAAGGLAFIAVEGCFRQKKPTHRDYLGSLLGLGLKRGKLGDILVTEKGAQLVAAAEIAEYILSNLLKVSRWEVDLREIHREELVPPQEKVKEINTTVASLRLDSVAAAGFGISRTRMAGEIIAEKVHLNWKGCSDPARAVAPGDVISIKGRGRVEVSGVKGVSRSGRIFITLKKLL